MKPFEYVELCTTGLFKIKNSVLQMSKALSLIPEFEFLDFQLNRLIGEIESVAAEFENFAGIERKEPLPLPIRNEKKISKEDMYVPKCRGNLADMARKIVEMLGELKTIGELHSTEKYNVLTNRLDGLLRSVVEVIVDFDEANVNKMKEKDYLPTAKQLEKENIIEKEKMDEINRKQLALRSAPSYSGDEGTAAFRLSQTPTNVPDSIPKGPPIKQVKQLKKKQPKAENKMKIDSLIALADKLDEAGQEEEANRIDEMVKKITTEEIIPPIVAGETEKKIVTEETSISHCASPSINVAFEKLASIADKLDEIGAREEANLIDEFLSKHANEKEMQLDHIRDTISRNVAWFINPKNNDPNKMAWDLETIIELLHKYKELSGSELKDAVGQASAEMAKEAAPKKSENVDPYDSKKHNEMQVRQPKKEKKEVEEHHVAPYQAHNSTLSIRNCPVHIGVPVARIGEHTYQCSLDGEIFNWETGWTGADGEVHPGGSVAAQTPQSTEYAIPSRIFDSREKILNGASY